MGDHDSWYTLASPEFWAAFEHGFEPTLAREWKWMMFQGTHFTMLHVVGALLSFLFVVFLATRYRASIKDSSGGVVPAEKYGLAAMTDGFVGVCFKMSSDVMGEEKARRYLPLTGTLALFIFCMNIQGLIPGMLPPSDTLKTNLALALIVFVIYNVQGLRANGLGYLAHFLGPKMGKSQLPLMAPLMLPIEIASHIARPVSLSVRLMGNMLADHKVVGVMLGIFALLLPVPFLLLGTLVVIVQTLVFTLLAVIYIAMATEHHEEH
jgi:F-type H+-transporting ATPase subunit a